MQKSEDAGSAEKEAAAVNIAHLHSILGSSTSSGRSRGFDNEDDQTRAELIIELLDVSDDSSRF